MKLDLEELQVREGDRRGHFEPRRPGNHGAQDDVRITGKPPKPCIKVEQEQLASNRRARKKMESMRIYVDAGRDTPKDLSWKCTCDSCIAGRAKPKRNTGHSFWKGS